MYGIFLLVLLADVARAHALGRTEGESSTRSIPRFAMQIRDSATDDAIHLLLARKDTQVNRIYRTRLSGSGRATTWAIKTLIHPSNPVVLSMLAPVCGSNSSSSFLQGWIPLFPGQQVLEHMGSPAP